ncbi:hypothetical protein JKG47_06585, partial [Acidithiobacillus sp. MC6.1]|nr:hypothetical protein [Acidithiobacillus sp. MC6.1]
PVGMGGFIQRVDRAKDGTRARFHQIDLSQSPASIAQRGEASRRASSRSGPFLFPPTTHHNV